MCDFNRWTILSLIMPEYYARIKFAVVFGCNGNEAIFVTEDDQVFGIGTNASSCLGIGNGHNTLDPIRIDALCDRSVLDICSGSGPHVLALTEDGQVYSWGQNNYCQLGNGGTNLGVSPNVVAGNLMQHKIVKISCGSHHSVAVAESGEVYTWGHNGSGQLGLGNSVNQPLPRKVSGSLTGKFMKNVVCGQNWTTAVSEEGELYSWGCNSNGQLGIGSTVNQPNPCRVLELHDVVVSQIACGFAHSIILSDQGDVYAWGSNSCGQLASACRNNQLVPTRTAAEIGRVVQIAAVHACNISAAVTHANGVYVWGLVRGQSIATPHDTHFKNIDDVFACFAGPSVCWRPLVFARPSTNKSLQESLKAAFDDSATSDITFIVEGRTIYAHKALLKIRCEHFRSMLQEGAWSEAGKDTIEITQFTYPVYKAFIYYLYTDELDLTPDSAIGLLDLANSYCEFELKTKGIEAIKHSITVDNAILLYAAAVRFDTKELEDYCFRFCVNHMTAVAQTDAFQRLDEVTVKHFITEAAKSGAFKH